jgi:hypothetical protein
MSLKTKCKLPPFSKPLYELIKSGRLPENSVNVWIGNKAWDMGKSFSISYPKWTITLPPWNDPYYYIWPVRGCDVIIWDTGYAEDDYVEDLAYCLLREGANKALYSSPEYKLTIYNRE